MLVGDGIMAGTSDPKVLYNGKEGKVYLVDNEEAALSLADETNWTQRFKNFFSVTSAGNWASRRFSNSKRKTSPYMVIYDTGSNKYRGDEGIQYPRDKNNKSIHLPGKNEDLIRLIFAAFSAKKSLKIGGEPNMVYDILERFGSVDVYEIGQAFLRKNEIPDSLKEYQIIWNYCIPDDDDFENIQGLVGGEVSPSIAMMLIKIDADGTEGLLELVPEHLWKMDSFAKEAIRQNPHVAAYIRGYESVVRETPSDKQEKLFDDYVLG